MTSDLTRVLAIDPGKMTGLARYDVPYKQWDALALPFDRDANDLAAMVWLHDQLADGGISDVVSESIVISKQTAKKSQDVQASIEQIGIARYLCAGFGVRYHLQTPSEGLGFGTDAKLKAMDMWFVGSDHPRAATKHLVTFLCKKDPEFARAVSIALDSDD